MEYVVVLVVTEIMVSVKKYCSFFSEEPQIVTGFNLGVTRPLESTFTLLPERTS